MYEDQSRPPLWVIDGDVKALRQEFHATMDKTVRMGLQADREMLGEMDCPDQRQHLGPPNYSR